MSTYFLLLYFLCLFDSIVKLSSLIKTALGGGNIEGFLPYAFIGTREGGGGILPLVEVGRPPAYPISFGGGGIPVGFPLFAIGGYPFFWC